MPREEGPAGLIVMPDAMVVAQALYESDGKRRIRLASAPTPGGALGADGNITDESGLQTAVRRMMSSQAIRCEQVAVALREPEVVTQLIRLPLMPRSETRGAVQGIAEQYALFSNEEVAVDFTVVDEVLEGGAKKESVLLAAAKKKAVDSWETVIAGTGGEISAMEPAVLAILRAIYEELNAPLSVASVVIDGQKTYINIFQGGVLRVSYTIGMGTPAARRRARRKGPDYSEGDQPEEGSAPGFPKPLLAEMRNALRFFQIQHTPSRCERIVLVTEEQAPNDVAQVLATELGVEVQVFDPRAHWTFDSNSLKELEELNMVQVLTAIGLALWEDAGAYPLQLNLRRRMEVKAPSVKVPVAIAGLVAVVMLSGSIVASTIVQREQLQTEAKTAELKPQVESQKTVVKALEERREINLKMQQAIQAQINQAHANQNMLWSQVVQQISTRVPSDLWLTSVKSTSREVKLEGYALETRSIADYIELLSGSSYFQYATLASIEKEKAPSGRSVIKFGITGRLAGS